MSNIKTSRAFTLIEVLVAMGILFFTSTAIVALSNALTQGTIVSADRTVTNRLAAEGLAAVTKIRDDNFQASVKDPGGLPVWLAAAIAENGADYGWYQLTPPNLAVSGTWELTKITGGTTFESTELETLSDVLKSGQLTSYRLICLESVAAANWSVEGEWRCNVNSAGARLTDGSRTNLADCDPGDLFCQMTKLSLTRQTAREIIIPAGNAIKVRSVVVWQDRDLFRSVSIGTLLTNWREFGQ